MATNDVICSAAARDGLHHAQHILQSIECTAEMLSELLSRDLVSSSITDGLKTLAQVARKQIGSSLDILEGKDVANG